MEGKKYSQKAINKYQKDKYYRASVTFPKEYKDALESAAADRGVSVSRFISDLVGRELGLDLALQGVLPYLQAPGASMVQTPRAGGSDHPAGDAGPDEQACEK